MRAKLVFLVLAYFSFTSTQVITQRYEPNWSSLDARPLPEWYDRGKIGIFLHWSVFSVPSHLSAWFWWDWKTTKIPAYTNFMKLNYKPGFNYPEFAPMFTAEFYDPNKWAQIFQKSGAKYMVLTSKHHEGYALFNSSYGLNWNSVDVGPHRDLVGELAEAVKKTDVRFGLYHSLMEWYQPDFERDQANHWKTRNFPENKLLPTLRELIEKYKPDVLWSDGDWLAKDKYWGSEDFLAWLYNDSPVKDTVVTNDRWGDGTKGLHGGFYNYADKFNPGVLMSHKWENAFTIDRHAWVYRRDVSLQDILSPEEIISTIVETVACGGNALVNVGPTKEGTIPVIFEERLMQMGEWLGVNGEAIYDSVPWTRQNDTVTQGVWYTTNREKSKVYAIALRWPKRELVLGAAPQVSTIDSVEMLGTIGKLKWVANPSGGIRISLPRPDENASKWAWTFVINFKR